MTSHNNIRLLIKLADHYLLGTIGKLVSWATWRQELYGQSSNPSVGYKVNRESTFMEIIIRTRFFFLKKAELYFNLFNCRISHSWRTRRGECYHLFKELGFVWNKIDNLIKGCRSQKSYQKEGKMRKKVHTRKMRRTLFLIEIRCREVSVAYSGQMGLPWSLLAVNDVRPTYIMNPLKANHGRREELWVSYGNWLERRRHWNLFRRPNNKKMKSETCLFACSWVHEKN